MFKGNILVNIPSFFSVINPKFKKKNQPNKQTKNPAYNSAGTLSVKLICKELNISTKITSDILFFLLEDS